MYLSDPYSKDYNSIRYTVFFFMSNASLKVAYITFSLKVAYITL